MGLHTSKFIEYYTVPADRFTLHVYESVYRIYNIGPALNSNAHHSGRAV
jgi:hypothetical protein